MNDSARIRCLRLDQRRRWQEGERVATEAYLERNPGLKSDPEAVLELIYNEILLREEAGTSPWLDEYVARFPQYANQLRIQFEVHQVLEGSSLTSVNPIAGEDFTPSASDSEALPGEGVAIPGYEILDELGRGGMGVVYRARQVSLKRVVALKMLLAGAHAGARERASFRTEAEAVARLQHPNIVQIYHIDEHDGLPYFSLEFVAGPSLEKMIAEQPLSPEQAARVVETLARAIHHAHRQGIIHRDLKPSNVLLAAPPDGSAEPYVPKITDFGVAKLLDAGSKQTATGEFVGTPHYMAPEQAAGEKGIGPAADIHALGAILYQLLTGWPPFQGNTVLAVLQQVRTCEPVPPSRVCARVPRDLETICLKCLEKDARRRYATAYDLAEDLRSFLAGEPIKARPAGRWERLWRRVKRRPAVAALVIVCAAAVIGLVLLGGWQSARVRASRDKYRQFVERYDKALFHDIYATSFADGDGAENVRAARNAAQEALAAVHVTADDDAPPAPDRYLSDRENSEIATGCYQLLLLLAESEADRGRALQILERAGRWAPATPAYYLRRARYLHEQPQGKDIKPVTGMDYFLLGEEHWRRGGFARAIQDFHSALQLQRDDFWSHFFLALCYFQRGDRGDLAAAQASLAKCLELRPSFVWTYLVRGSVHERMGALADAEDDFKKTLDLDAKGDARYFLYANRGQMRLRQGQHKLAAADLKEAIALKPNLFFAHLVLGRVYQKENNLGESNRQLAEAIARRPPDAFLAQCHLEQARNQYLDRKYADALQVCNQALKLVPDETAAHFLHAQILMALGRYPEGLQSLDRFQEKGGQVGTDFYRARGSTRLHVADYAGAIADYTRLLEVEKDAEVYCHRGWAFYFADAWKQALLDFEDSLRRDANNSDAYVGRGLSRVMLGDYREAAADAEKALTRPVDNPNMMHNIACIFALAVGKIGAASDATNHRDLANKYQQRALDALRRALDLVAPDERVAFWREKVLPDDALNPIRNCAEFKKLVKNFGGVASEK